MALANLIAGHGGWRLLDVLLSLLCSRGPVGCFTQARRARSAGGRRHPDDERHWIDRAGLMKSGWELEVLLTVCALRSAGPPLSVRLDNCQSNLQLWVMRLRRARTSCDWQSIK